MEDDDDASRLITSGGVSRPVARVRVVWSTVCRLCDACLRVRVVSSADAIKWIYI